jgi:CRP-like cAMP-binding protein
LADKAEQRNGSNRLLAALPPAVLALLRRDLDDVALAQGTVLYEAGDAVDRIYFPHTGVISLLVVMRGGGTVETSAIGREGALGLHRGLGERRSFTRATVQVPGRFSTIAGARFERCVNQSDWLRGLVERYLEVLWAEAQQVAACNAIHDASSRLCRWLLQCADHIDSGNVPVTQEFLAQTLGLRRTSVTLLMQALHQRGPVRRTRGNVAILDRAALEAGACECYQVIRHEKRALWLGATL